MFLTFQVLIAVCWPSFSTAASRQPAIVLLFVSWLILSAEGVCVCVCFICSHAEGRCSIDQIPEKHSGGTGAVCLRDSGIFWRRILGVGPSGTPSFLCLGVEFQLHLQVCRDDLSESRAFLLEATFRSETGSSSGWRESGLWSALK